MKTLSALRLTGLVIAAALSPYLVTTAEAQTATAQVTDAQALDAWRDFIAQVPLPYEGCFTASYPDTTWTETSCVTAPQRPFVPRHTWPNWMGTVGNGNDYAAVVTGIMTTSTGAFPKISGLKSETGTLGANDYTLQLNSNFMKGSPACANASNPMNCLAWEQFVYSSGYTSGFMQYWLIYYDTTCPSGWTTYTSGSTTDCYKNSKAVSIPLQKINQLGYLKLKGSAVKGGIDTFVLTTKTTAYSTTGKDSVVYLAKGWNASEFNIFGDCCGSEANFNKGTNLTDTILVTNGTTKAPTHRPVPHRSTFAPSRGSNGIRLNVANSVLIHARKSSPSERLTLAWNVAREAA
jgi:hypothetical protein